MTGTSWTEIKTNLEALREMKEDRRLLQKIEFKKFKFKEYIKQYNEFIRIILEDKVLGMQGLGNII